MRLARYFGTSPQFWLGLQSDYDLDVDADELGERLEREVQVRAKAASTTVPGAYRHRRGPEGRGPQFAGEVVVSAAASAAATSASRSVTVNVLPSPETEATVASPP